MASIKDTLFGTGQTQLPEDPHARAQRDQEYKENYLYGNQEGGLDRFNQATAGIANSYGDEAVAVGREYGGQLSTLGHDQYAGGRNLQGMGIQALGADADRYIDQGALDATRASAGGVTGVGDRLLEMSRAPRGPSAAEAQLRAGNAALGNQNLALATSGRGLGGGAAARRAAMAQNAQSSGAMSAQLSTLRAQEEAQHVQQQQGAAAAAGQAYGAAGGINAGIMSGVAGARSASIGDATSRGVGLINEGNAGMAGGAATIGAGGTLNLSGVGQGATTELAGQQLTNDANKAALDAGVAKEVNITNRIRGDQENSSAIADRSVQKEGAYLSAGGSFLTSLGATFSDRRAKTDVARVKAPVEIMAPGGAGQPTEAERFAERLQALRAPEAPERAPGGSTPMPTPRQAADTIRETPAYSFRYKDPERHGEGQRLGVMAQDLERTPTGSRAVSRAPDGTRMVDTSELTTINTAALHNVQERQDDLDERLRRFASMVKPTDTDALDRAAERERSFR
jgi:hypothetical protein